MENKIPENTNVEAKLFKFLYMKDLAVILLVLGLIYILYAMAIIPPKYTGFAWIFGIAYAIILVVRPFATNPKRRNYRALLITIKKDRNVYEEIPAYLVEKYKEENSNANVQAKRTYKDVLNKSE